MTWRPRRGRGDLGEVAEVDNDAVLDDQEPVTDKPRRLRFTPDVFPRVVDKVEERASYRSSGRPLRVTLVNNGTRVRSGRVAKGPHCPIARSLVKRNSAFDQAGSPRGNVAPIFSWSQS